MRNFENLKSDKGLWNVLLKKEMYGCKVVLMKKVSLYDAVVFVDSEVKRGSDPKDYIIRECRNI